MKTKSNSKDLRSKIFQSAKAPTLKSKSLLIIFLFFLGNCINMYGQMNNWAMPPFKMKVSQSPVLPSALYSGAPSSGVYNIANSAYDSYNNLLFYIKDNQVMKPNGTGAGYLGNLTGNLNSTNLPYNNDFGGELVIVPMPYNCKKFYVFYSQGDNVGYSIVDCTGASIVVYKETSGGNTNEGFLVNAFQNNGGLIGNSSNYYCCNIQLNTGLAVSKRRLNTFGGGYVYYLYMVNDGKVYYCTITSVGVSAVGAAIYNSGYSGKAPTEVELSDDGQHLAFNAVGMYDNCTPGMGGCTLNGYYIHNSGDVFVVKLPTPTTAIYEWTNNWNSTIINGLEFMGTTSPVLFVAGEIYFQGPGASTSGFLDKCDFTNNTITGCIPSINGNPPFTPLQDGHLQPKKTFLELTKTGKIAYICNAYNNATNQYGNRYFVEYDDNLQTFTPTQIDAAPVDVNPNDASAMAQAMTPANTYFLSQTYKNVFTLPDQIDGEDYSKFTNPNIAISSMNINGEFHPNCDPSNWQLVYNCDRIALNVGLESGEACNVDIKYEPLDENCRTLSAGFYYNGPAPFAAFSAYPIQNYDIRVLRDDYGHSLTNQPGYYRVTAIITDCCGNKTSSSTYVRVLQGITPNFTPLVYDKSNSCGGPPSQCYVPLSQNISAPTMAGASTFAYLITANTGNITILNTKIEEVNNVGTTLNLIVNEDYGFQNFNTALPINLNNFCVSPSLWTGIPTTPGCNVTGPAPYTGNKGYFADLSGINSIGKYYKLTITLKNPCSSSTKWGYFFVDAFARPSGITGIGNIGEDNLNLTVYPNPAQNEISFNFINKSTDPISIVLYDVSGRIVKTIKNDAILPLDEQHIKADIQNLENGTYFWNVTGKEIHQTGKVVIAK